MFDTQKEGISVVKEMRCQERKKITQRTKNRKLKFKKIKRKEINYYRKKINNYNHKISAERRAPIKNNEKIEEIKIRKEQCKQILNEIS